MIELICDAADEEDAGNIAGEYLRGKVDFGVEMKCRTGSFRAHKVKKYTGACAITCLVFSGLLLNVTPIGVDTKIRDSAHPGFRDTCTIMPVLKTRHKSDFKKEWEKKKGEVVLDYLKK